MKRNTGIIRRIDALGRVSIPKMLMLKFNIKEEDSFKVAFEENGTICFIPIQEEEEE